MGWALGCLGSCTIEVLLHGTVRSLRALRLHGWVRDEFVVGGIRPELCFRTAGCRQSGQSEASEALGKSYGDVLGLTAGLEILFGLCQADGHP